LALSLVVLWLAAVVIGGPCVCGAVDLPGLPLNALSLAGASLILLLPFLVLALLNSCYRDRLKSLLKLTSDPAASPPASSPAPSILSENCATSDRSRAAGPPSPWKLGRLHSITKSSQRGQQLIFKSSRAETVFWVGV
jgi:hypothetical protein